MYKNPSECQKQFLCTCSVLPRFELGIFMHQICNSMNNLLWNCGLVDAKITKCFWQRFTCILNIIWYNVFSSERWNNATFHPFGILKNHWLSMFTFLFTVLFTFLFTWKVVGDLNLYWNLDLELDLNWKVSLKCFF